MTEGARACWKRPLGDALKHWVFAVEVDNFEIEYDTQQFISFFPISLSRDAHKGGEQNGLHENGRCYGTRPTGGRREESGPGRLPAHNRGVLQIP